MVISRSSIPQQIMKPGVKKKKNLNKEGVDKWLYLTQLDFLLKMQR